MIGGQTLIHSVRQYYLDSETRDISMKEDYKPIFLMNNDAKILARYTSNPAIFKRFYTRIKWNLSQDARVVQYKGINRP